MSLRLMVLGLVIAPIVLRGQITWEHVYTFDYYYHGIHPVGKDECVFLREQDILRVHRSSKTVDTLSRLAPYFFNALDWNENNFGITGYSLPDTTRSRFLFEYTYDEGKTWSQWRLPNDDVLPPVGKLNIYGLSIMQDSSFFVLIHKKLVLHVDPSLGTYSMIYLPFDTRWVHFTTEDRGFCIGDSTIACSNDQGRTWVTHLYDFPLYAAHDSVAVISRFDSLVVLGVSGSTIRKIRQPKNGLISALNILDSSSFDVFMNDQDDDLWRYFRFRNGWLEDNAPCGARGLDELRGASTAAAWLSVGRKLYSLLYPVAGLEVSSFTTLNGTYNRVFYEPDSIAMWRNIRIERSGVAGTWNTVDSIRYPRTVYWDDRAEGDSLYAYRITILRDSLPERSYEKRIDRQDSAHYLDLLHYVLPPEGVRNGYSIYVEAKHPGFVYRYNYYLYAKYLGPHATDGNMTKVLHLISYESDTVIVDPIIEHLDYNRSITHTDDYKDYGIKRIPARKGNLPQGWSMTIETVQAYNDTYPLKRFLKVSTEEAQRPPQHVKVSDESFIRNLKRSGRYIYERDAGYSSGEYFYDARIVTEYIRITKDTVITRLADSEHEYGLRLQENYPNPFRDETLVGLSIQKSAHVRLQIHNAIGQVVATLIDEHLHPGTYAVQYKTGNLPSGMYFCIVQSGNVRLVQKMLRMK